MNKPRIPLVVQIMLGLAAGIIVGAILHQFPESRPWMISNILQPAGD
ncbi:MAG: sodium:dicarboxylate symporter, partial [Cytophagaceae bacterium]